MIVLLPSYKRTFLLHTVINSILNSSVSNIDENITILIVNNAPENKSIVNQITSSFKYKHKFKLEIIHRDKTMPGVYSWFDALGKKAKENEVICMLGDDDILYPLSLEKRYLALKEFKADMLLTKYTDRLYFYDNGNKCFLDGKLETYNFKDYKGSKWLYSNYPSSGPRGSQPSFVSNHSYRYTSSLKKGLKKAYLWCDAQSDVSEDMRTGNIPFYLAYAIKASDGIVVECDFDGVIRGQVVEEIGFQEYADGGSTAFFNLLLYDTFSNKNIHDDLGLFKEIRDHFKNAFLTGFISILLNKKISNKVLCAYVKKCNISFYDRRVFIALRNIIIQVFGLRGYRLKQKSKTNTFVDTKNFLNSNVWN